MDNQWGSDNRGVVPKIALRPAWRTALEYTFRMGSGSDTTSVDSSQATPGTRHTRKDKSADEGVSPPPEFPFPPPSRTWVVGLTRADPE